MQVEVQLTSRAALGNKPSDLCEATEHYYTEAEVTRRHGLSSPGLPTGQMLPIWSILSDKQINLFLAAAYSASFEEDQKSERSQREGISFPRAKEWGHLSVRVGRWLPEESSPS